MCIIHCRVFKICKKVFVSSSIKVFCDKNYSNLVNNVVDILFDVDIPYVQYFHMSNRSPQG